MTCNYTLFWNAFGKIQQTYMEIYISQKVIGHPGHLATNLLQNPSDGAGIR